MAAPTAWGLENLFRLKPRWGTQTTQKNPLMTRIFKELKICDQLRSFSAICVPLCSKLSLPPKVKCAWRITNLVTRTSFAPNREAAAFKQNHIAPLASPGAKGHAAQLFAHADLAKAMFGVELQTRLVLGEDPGLQRP